MQRKIIILLALLVLLTGCGMAEPDIVISDAQITTESVDEADEAVSFVEAAPESIYVYVCGAVKAPGVYELQADSRAIDAVEAAGGFSEEADQFFVNLAALLQDGVKLQIPTVEQTAESSISQDLSSFDSENASDNNLVNINTASKEELKTLPGIGDGIAGRIIEYRDNSGSFKKKEDIMQVRGIKEKLFDKIKDYITT